LRAHLSFLGFSKGVQMIHKQNIYVLGFFLAAGLLMPGLAHAGLESSLVGIKMKLTGVILPLLSVIGIALAALSFFTGNPQSKQHIAYAILGCIFGFGAQAIVDFIAQTVR
jgi:type IV secretory pathway VirB2 component (pilin)